METTVFEIKFIDGRVFRIFCANRHQKERFLKSVYPIAENDASVKVALNGMHTIEQWEQILPTLIK